MGDEMSKRKKFIFLTWIGQDVGVIQRAKMSTDKAIIKDVLNVSKAKYARINKININPTTLFCRILLLNCKLALTMNWTLNFSVKL